MKYAIIENPETDFEIDLKDINETAFIKNNENNYILIDLIKLGTKNILKIKEKFPQIKINEFTGQDLKKTEYEELAKITKNSVFYDELFLIIDSKILKVFNFDDIVYETNNIITADFSKDGRFIFVVKDDIVDVLSADCKLFNRFFIKEAKKVQLFGTLLIIWAKKLYIKNIITSDSIYEKVFENDNVGFFKNHIIINENTFDFQGKAGQLKDLIDTDNATGLISSNESYFLDFKNSFKFVNEQNKIISRKLDNVNEKKVWFKENTLFIKLYKEVGERKLELLDIYQGANNISIPLTTDQKIFSSEKMVSLISDTTTCIYKIGQYLECILKIMDEAKHVAFFGDKYAILFDTKFEIYLSEKKLMSKTCISGDKIEWSPNGLFVSIIKIGEACTGKYEIYNISGKAIRKMSVTGLKEFKWCGFPKLDYETKKKINENWDEYKTSVKMVGYGEEKNQNIDEMRNKWVGFLLKQKELLKS
ncbi:hypothetical protein CDIK_0489 [Cucumispora dikerogammari]|nr:hypothetical protein CDIK_0489 [Cucumispora dikerogammari]